jgi:nitrate/TMAO reductase-like tetraheme cytochrome c subunit
MRGIVIIASVVAVIAVILSIVINRPENAIAGPANNKYVSEKRCYMCHRAQAKQHENTAHAKTFKRLLDNGQDKNPKCLPCHTVGYGKPSGFMDVKSTPDLAGVGCQACHGPGSAHIEEGLSKEQKRQTIELTTSDACVKCHKIHEKHIDVNKK